MRRFAGRSIAAVVTLLGAVLVVLAPQGGAQTGYPPPTTTVVTSTTTSTVVNTTTTRPGATTTTTRPVATTTTVAGCPNPTGSQDAGAFNVGASFSIRMQPACPFDVGSLVGINVNGQGIGTKEADGSGGVNVAVRVVSETTLEIDDPITVAGQCGVNTVVATGSSRGTGVTQTATFTVLCPGGAARAVKGRVAFTGANLLRWGAAAAALAALGGVLMVASRRRRASDNPTA